MRLLCLAVVALVGGCSPTFESVRQTASLGTRIAEEAPVMLSGPYTCQLVLGATSRAGQPGTATKGCDELGVKKNTEIMLQGARLLAAYARALGDLAQDSRLSLGSLLDFLGGTKATIEGQAGGSLSVSSAGKKLSALMALASTRWRRQEIGRFVIEAGPEVAAIGVGLRLHVRLHREALRSLRGDGKDGQGERGLLATLQRELDDMAQFLRCGEKDTTCSSLRRFGPLWALGLVSLGAWAAEQDHALAAFDRTLQGFLIAHAHLARRAAAPGGLAPDEAIVNEIKQEIAAIAAPQGEAARARSDQRD